MRALERRLRKLESRRSPPEADPLTLIIAITKPDGQVVPGLVVLIDGDNSLTLEGAAAEKWCSERGCVDY